MVVIRPWHRWVLLDRGRRPPIRPLEKVTLVHHSHLISCTLLGMLWRRSATACIHVFTACNGMYDASRASMSHYPAPVTLGSAVEYLLPEVLVPYLGEPSISYDLPSYPIGSNLNLYLRSSVTSHSLFKYRLHGLSCFWRFSGTPPVPSHVCGEITSAAFIGHGERFKRGSPCGLFHHDIIASHGFGPSPSTAAVVADSCACAKSQPTHSEREHCMLLLQDNHGVSS